MPTIEQRNQIAAFLKASRARLQPEEVDLRAGSRRRTPGLRREEVALLADISVEWYKWLEQARDVRASAQTIERLGRALRLEPAELRHLLHLSGHPVKPLSDQALAPTVSGNLQRLLDELTPCPAYVHGRRWDVLAWNDAAGLVLGDFANKHGVERNCLYQGFAGSLRSQTPDWESHAKGLVARFRSDYSRHAGDPRFEELVDILRNESIEFERWWADQAVVGWRDGIKRIEHPELGLLSFEYSGLDVADDRLSDLRIVTLVPLDGSDTRARIEARLAAKAGQ